MKLTAHEATIQTATVEIKTLTISGKQVTLAVFRQLRQHNLISEETALFNGIPWGTVNYHPDKCGGDDTFPHVHVVWQSGDELLRDSVYWHSDRIREWRECIEESMCNYAVARILRGDDPFLCVKRTTARFGKVEFRGELHTIRLDTRLEDFMNTAEWDRKHDRASTFGLESLAKKYADYVGPGAVEKLEEELLDDIKGLENYRSQLRLRHDEIKKLPQLFIAV